MRIAIIKAVPKLWELKQDIFIGKKMWCDQYGYWRFVHKCDSDRARRKYGFSNRLGYYFGNGLKIGRAKNESC
jgi:hypothetical protein